MNENKEHVFFKTQNDFRKWLEKNSKKATELLVGFYKIDSGKPSLTWSQSVDQAICFGWIDGIRRSIDDESYCIRFTPRKSTSKWSEINIKKVEELTKLGLMKPEGIKAFQLKDEQKLRGDSRENQQVELPEAYKKRFTSNKKAWTYFCSMPPYYRKVTVRWVMDAKQEKTRDSRLETLINDSAVGQKIKVMRVGSKN
jgi:uncharacterized protein YdeI (YjbR/CyaY-like superfamily)